MKKIVGIGANVHDTLITVPNYTPEDTKMRANAVIEVGGGPCATGLVAASKLGATCSYIGVLSTDSGGEFLRKDLERFNVSYENTDICDGTSFSSYILLAKDKATRTCVFTKGTLPPLLLDEKKKAEIKNADLLMIDGNEMEAAIEGAKHARENGTKVLYDAGGLYENVEKLLPYADILIPSEEFAKGFTACDTVEDAARNLYDLFHPEVVVITCGSRGGIIFDGKEINEYPAFLVEAVDSNGAGDVFHGAFAYGVVSGFDYYKCCVFSSAVSAIKCTKVGARDGVPKLDEVIEFLKERGVNV